MVDSPTPTVPISSEFDQRDPELVPARLAERGRRPSSRPCRRRRSRCRGSVSNQLTPSAGAQLLGHRGTVRRRHAPARSPRPAEPLLNLRDKRLVIGNEIDPRIVAIGLVPAAEEKRRPVCSWKDLIVVKRNRARALRTRRSFVARPGAPASVARTIPERFVEAAIEQIVRRLGNRARFVPNPVIDRLYGIRFRKFARGRREKRDQVRNASVGHVKLDCVEGSTAIAASPTATQLPIQGRRWIPGLSSLTPRPRRWAIARPARQAPQSRDPRRSPNE